MSATVENLKDLNFLSLDEKLQKTCDELGLYDPMILLAGLANGKDLTAQNPLIVWLEDHIKANGDEPPDEFDWLDLVELIKENYQFGIVDETVKINAQKTLAEYLHNKKKSVEVTDKTTQASVTDLSGKEVRRFKRIFNKEY